MTEFDRRTVEEFRANGGRAGGALAGTPLVLIHHLGARTGIEHVTPLAYSAIDGDSIAIAASNGGSPKHPAWCHNLRANPAITVELGTQRFEATAEEQTGPARAELWPRLVAQFPDLAKFQAGTDRPIPLFLLRPAPSPPAPAPASSRPQPHQPLKIRALRRSPEPKGAIRPERHTMTPMSGPDC